MDVFSAVIVFIAFLLVLRAERRLEGMQTRLDRLEKKPVEAPQPDYRLRVWTNPRFAKAGRPDHPAA
jgi:hypothetical protein